ncbi:hypothetical protein [Acidiphilium angustum]|uniref:hypothetical protein n=1 Tax=Acidiphilium angustum TaxID=523 RepID=UPI0012DD6B09|nr:hypothetical protein [Acidiphilium angustum]
MNHAWIEGWNARVNGKSLNENPYYPMRALLMGQDWESGWYAASRSQFATA